jgi:hypothetical protein
MILDEYMKGNGLKIRDMETVLSNIKMEMCIKESSKTISQMEKEHIIGTITRFMMENGKMVGNMV